jgi:CRP/FNR family transcriptional regulator, cyclic AMP receptor protein
MKILENTVHKHPFLAGLPPEHIALLLREAKQVEFAPNDVIFREGDPANRFYLIQTGRIALESRAGGRGMVLIHQLGDGDVIGWSWLFAPFAWHFQARALQPTRAVICDAANLLEMCEENHDIGYELMKRVSRMLIRRLQATRKQLVQIQAILHPPVAARPNPRSDKANALGSGKQ